MTPTRLWEGTKGLGRAYGADAELEVHQCGECGVIFAMQLEFSEARRQDHGSWKCPNGHSFHFSGKNDKQKLREAQEALARTRRQAAATRELLHAEERSHASTRGHVTRKRKELENVRAGVCPVDGCRRHFRDLRRHIATKHPTYKP